MATSAERARDRIYRKRRAPAYAPGALSERITLMRVFHDHGESAFLEIPASKADQGVREHWRSGEVQAKLTTRFTVRWSPKSATVRPQDAIEHNGQRFEIVGIRETGRREWIEITAVRRTDMGE